LAFALTLNAGPSWMRASPNTANAGTAIAMPTICERVHGCTHECRKTASMRTITARGRVLRFSRKGVLLPVTQASRHSRDSRYPGRQKITENRFGDPTGGSLDESP